MKSRATPLSRRAKRIRSRLAGKNFDLSRIRQIHLDELPIEGRADFTLQASGTVGTPVIEAAVHVRNLTFDRELTGDFFLQTTDEGKGTCGERAFEFPEGSLTVDGTVGMQGTTAKITAHMDHLDLDALVARLHRRYNYSTGNSAVVGSVTMQRPLRYAQQWRIDGNLADVVVDVEYAKLHNQGPVRFTYADRTLQIPQTHLVGDATTPTGHLLCGGTEAFI